MKSMLFMLICLSTINSIASTNLKKQTVESSKEQKPEEQSQVEVASNDQIEIEDFPLSELMKESGLKRLREVIKEQFKLIAEEKAKDEEKEASMKKTRDIEVSNLTEIISAKLAKIREYQSKKRDSLIEKYKNKLNYVDEWIKKEEEILSSQLDFLIKQADESFDLRLNQEVLELKNRLDGEYNEAIQKYKDQMNDTKAVLQEKLNSISSEDKEKLAEMLKDHSIQIELSIENTDSTLESVQESLDMSSEEASAIRREESEKFNIKNEAAQ